jgi:single-strand DNA-binding protein
VANEPVVTLCGNATADAELVFGPSGDARCTFTLAVTPRVKRGERYEDGETAFYRCTAWREFGESVASSVTKGMRLLVQGRFSPRTYEKDGERRTSLDLTVDHVGAEMRYASVSARKVERFPGEDRSSQPAMSGGPTEDPWGGQSSELPPF